ncbi:nitrous oxide-stimulated promoter family protein [Desulfuribacillus alkaliarsenatis]|uniref:Nitrous oxide-stimulated promoter n=1 Tax=Desulfuribacillus alkaliarsenatis TaxID=766136 RepID=A0A1E5G4V7_9FIRM|nr:nitrous oxide-stimulated promoter family protein [Desulfuribacillus alkaliarsenatis]OEF98149.1 hypothetical protein BHF68_00200 [Desulfuribacillus alkaliarsenatis]
MVGKRIIRELETIEKMIYIYCKDKHGTGGILCSDCHNLLEYARKRLHMCPHGESKPVCGNCKIHCYKKDKRQQVIDVMRYAGPRMTYKHPILALYHLLDSRKK